MRVFIDNCICGRKHFVLSRAGRQISYQTRVISRMKKAGFLL